MKLRRRETLTTPMSSAPHQGDPLSHPDSSQYSAGPKGHHLSRQLTLRDLVFCQVLSVVGSSWVGLAAGLEHAQTFVWLTAMVLFYFPMAVAVFFLNRELPIEGGLYVWVRTAFGDAAGFLIAWNLWLFGLSTIATILFQIPSECSFMIGTSAAWLPDSHGLVLGGLTFIILLIALAAFRGLALGKWIHNISSAAMISAFALLIFAPLWARLHHSPIHFNPFELRLPRRNSTSLALVGQILFASAGLEYVAILAGETKSPSRDIGRSVLWASPIIIAMFVLGTASVLALHELHPGISINYIAPIPQTLHLAFGDSGLGNSVGRFAIFLLQLRILGCSSFIFTGVTRLPMAAGWDHLIPAWFSRLHPRFRTPTNSIFLASAIIVMLIVLASIGVQAKETFALLNNASNTLYGTCYIIMFAIPILGTHALRSRLPKWVKWVCAIGSLTTVFSVGLNCYPFLEVPDPHVFVLKIVAVIVLCNFVGYLFYHFRH